MTDFNLKKFSLNNLRTEAEFYTRQGKTIRATWRDPNDSNLLRKQAIDFPSVNHAKRVSRKLQQVYGKTVRRIK